MQGPGATFLFTCRQQTGRIMIEPEPIVFVVDDDPSVRRSMERPRPEGPACLVLDVRLPGLSGLDLRRELTNSGIQLPIIFMTAHGDIAITVRAMKGGVVEFLNETVPRSPFTRCHPSLADLVRMAQKLGLTGQP
jgi:DNA-binding NarL/FixJ family response regulator